jgi:hypothetical protein
MTTVNLSPDLYFSAGTSVEMNDGTVTDPTDDGQKAKRDLYAAPVYDISARFTFIDAAQQDAMQEFFWNNRSADLLFTINGIQYLCTVVGKVRMDYPNGGVLGQLQVQFTGSKVAV